MRDDFLSLTPCTEFNGNELSEKNLHDLFLLMFG